MNGTGFEPNPFLGEAREQAAREALAEKLDGLTVEVPVRLVSFVAL